MTAPALDYDGMLRAAKAMGIPDDVAKRAVADEMVRRASNAGLIEGIGTSPPGSRVESSGGIAAPAVTERPVFDQKADATARTAVFVGADRFAIAKAQFTREYDVFTATFELPPRTKKNSTRWFGKQSIQYTRFRNAVVDSVKEAKTELALPLPDQAYNLAAVFYVDVPGQAADIFGLLQGIADALQDAGVISNDWHFRTVDGSRVVEGDDKPRVVVTITPIEA